MQDLRQRRNFDQRPGSVREVRSFVRELADEAGANAEDAMLLASELATNALVHAANGFEVRVSDHGGDFRVEIVDDAPEMVVALRQPSDERGRGLHIVDTIARRWGTDVIDREKVVWFELPTQATVSAPLPATALDTAQSVALRAAACVGAEYSNIALLDEPGTSLRLFHGPFLDPTIAARYTEVALDAAAPIAAAVRSGRPVFLPDLESYREHFAEMIPDTIASGVRGTASLPVFKMDGTPLGAIGFAWTDPPPFDVKLKSALEAVALLCTEAIEQAQRHDEEHRIIVGLQRRLLDDLPRSASINVAARYLPAGGEAVGGDWYEGLRVDDDHIAFVVGDVLGHGITAAADMAFVRGMITALLHSGVAVAEVFGQVSQVLRQLKAPLLATAALVLIDTAAQTITFATAGHPPPVVLDRDGVVRFLDTANGPLIGLDVKTPIAQSPTFADTAPFPRGSTLVIYTDGLIERRDRSIETGIHQLVTHLEHLPAPLAAEVLLDSLVDDLIGDHAPGDDIALLVVEHLAGEPRQPRGRA